MKRFIAIVVITFIGLLSPVLACSQEISPDIESFTFVINGTKVEFEKPVITIEGDTYVPLRELMYLLGMNINWLGETSSIIIGNDSNDEVFSLCPTEVDGQWGYADKQGNIVIQPEYNYAYEFSEGLALVRKGTGAQPEYLFIDQEGNVIIYCDYYRVSSFSDGAALVKLGDMEDGRWSYIDKQGNLLFNKDFALAQSFSEGYAAVLKEGYGFPVPPEYDVPKKWSFISKDGEYATNDVYEDVQPFNDGLAWVKNNGKWGLIDKSFHLVVDYQYEEFSHFHNGVAPVRLDEKWGCINKTGEVVVPFVYNSPYDITHAEK